MEEDAELAAIRQKLYQEMTQTAAQPEAQAPDAPALREPVDIDDASIAGFVREHSFVVVDVWAPWCGPCRIVGPIIDQLANEMSGKVAFGKLNADHNPRTMGTFGIQGIPTLLMFKDGKHVDTVVGAMPKAPLAQRIEMVRAGRRATGGAVGPRR